MMRMPKRRIIMIEALSRWVEVLHQEGAVGLLNTHSNPFLPLHSHMHWVHFLFTSSLSSLPAYPHSLSFYPCHLFGPCVPWSRRRNGNKTSTSRNVFCGRRLSVFSWPMPSACKGRQWWAPTKRADRVLWWMLGEWWCWWFVVVTVSLHIVITIPICRDWGFATLPVSTCALQCAVFFSSSSKSVQIQVLLLVTFWKSLDRPSLFWIHPLPLINPTADQPRKMKSETNLDSAEIGAVQWFGWCAGGLLTTQAPGVCWQSVMTCVASTLKWSWFCSAAQPPSTWLPQSAEVMSCSPPQARLFRHPAPGQVM